MSFRTKYWLQRLGTVSALALLAAGSRATAGEEVPFRASYHGSFVMTFGTGPGATDELHFNGTGTALHLGDGAIDGYSTLQHVNPLCEQIVTDQVVLTAANGDEVFVRNSGQDCLDFSTPGHIFIRGTATFEVTGGTGRFDGATGSGTTAVVAEIEQFGPDSASGPFISLDMDGRISRP